MDDATRATESGANMNTDEIAAIFNTKPDGKGRYMGLCTAHDDHNPSLSISEGKTGGTVIHCFAGCKSEAILATKGLTLADLMPSKAESPRTAKQKSKLVATYDYTDAIGNLLYQVCRFDPKGFRQRRPDPINSGKWVWNMDGVNRVLYRLPVVLKTKSEGRVIFICEGEKDCEALGTLGLCATCNPGGAGKWDNDYTESLTGAKVVIIPDRDAPGCKHATLVMNALTGKAEFVRVVELPDRDGRKVKDASDWVAAGGTVEALQMIVKNAPAWEPPTNAAEVMPTTNPIEADYGPPYFWGEKKDGDRIYLGLNESYWAGHHAANHVELFEPTEKCFYRYNPTTGLYSETTTAILKQEISSSLLQAGRKDDFGLVRDRTDTRLNSITSQLKGIIEKRDAFKKTENVIHLANGMLTLDKVGPKLGPFSPNHYSRNQSPISFDPNATCSRFLNELVLPAVHPEDVAIIQKYFGLCLLARNIIQRLLILDGEAGRGKSQLAIVIQLIVGLLNCTQLRTEHLNERFELFRFLKKTLLVGVDVPANFLSTKGATVIKGLVGGDILDPEQKGGTSTFTMEGVFCCILTSNSRLHVRLEGDVGAWRRRLLIVRYEAPPPKKKIPDFAKRLVAEEGPGILNWALEGLASLLQDVEEIGDIHLNERQTGIVDSLLSESDSLRVYLKTCVFRNPDSDLTVHEIISAYAEYCPTKGWNPLPVTVIQHQIESLMLELFQTPSANSIKRDEKSQKGFRNVGFKDFGILGIPILNPRAYGKNEQD